MMSSDLCSQGTLRVVTRIRQLKVRGVFADCLGFQCRVETAFTGSFSSCYCTRKHKMFTVQLCKRFPRETGLEGKQGDVRRVSVLVPLNSRNFKKQMCSLETAFSIACSIFSSYYGFLKINNN